MANENATTPAPEESSGQNVKDTTEKAAPASEEVLEMSVKGQQKQASDDNQAAEIDESHKSASNLINTTSDASKQELMMSNVQEQASDENQAAEIDEFHKSAPNANNTTSDANKQELMRSNVHHVSNLGASSKQQGKKFVFWSTQPVPQLDEVVTTNESIEANKQIEEIRAEPYNLPSDFIWVTLDLNDASDLKQLYTLLNENYVEDDDCMFRFDYQPEFLKWSLQSPGWKRDWHVGVRVQKSGKLVGFISAIPGKLRAYDKVIKVVDINFLCVHKKLRSKRVAPVLIREITRRVNLAGIFQAAYTAGVVLPTPVASCRYWHRSLNPKKLVDVRFSHLGPNMTMQRSMKLYRLPDQPKTRGYRRITPKDMDKAHKLLETYLKKFSLYPVFSREEFRHWFTPREGIIDCFVVIDDKGNVTDLTSYYCLPSSVMHHPVHKTVCGAYSFYNVSTKTPWLALMNDALISARNAQMDVYNALDLMENKKFIVPLKFGAGDGNLQYYLYNWRCPSMQPEDVALILM